MKNFKFILISILLLISLDRLFFGYVIWKLPNESPWNTNHFFNFVYELKNVQNKKTNKPKILLIGSSICFYSIDKTMLHDYLKEKTGISFSIEYFSYAGMTPLDAYLVFNQIKEIKPTLIVYPINFIDLRLHRAYVIKPTKTNYESDDSEIILDALNWNESPQSKYAFPWETLKEFYTIFPKEKNAEYLSATLFLFYRYREIYAKNLVNLYNHRFSRNISYHGYAGVQIPEGINSLGWTGKTFSFQPISIMKEEGFYIQVVPEILENGSLSIEFKNTEGYIQINTFNKPGWYQILLNSNFFISNSVIKATLSDTWVPNQAKDDRFDHSLDNLGVRLQQTFGLQKPNQDMQYTREYRMEDSRYLNMDTDTYQKYFYYRLLDDLPNRPGILYLHALKDAKVRLTQENFRPTIHYQFLKKFLHKTNEVSIKVLLINNPENPISLEWYKNSNWYLEQLEYLKQLNSTYTEFIDIHNLLKSTDFSDFHHITYPSMLKMNSIYGNYILNFLEKK